jgi:hypothetical protein
MVPTRIVPFFAMVHLLTRPNRFVLPLPAPALVRSCPASAIRGIDSSERLGDERGAFALA